MKIVVGVGESGQARNALSLLRELKFKDSHVSLVHVLEQGMAIGLDSVDPAFGSALAQVITNVQETAKKSLDFAKSEWASYGGKADALIVEGASSNKLLEYAHNQKADLLALGSNEHSEARKVLLGSVGRKALIASQASILIAKKDLPNARPLSVVVATDHSEYSTRCIKKLVEWSPKGIGRIVVTTVYSKQLIRTASAIVEKFKSNVDEWVRSELERNNQKAMEILRPLQCELTSQVIDGEVNHSLASVMAGEKADLLILGAQGHGFFERVVLGSVAMHQALTGPYSTLVIRG